MINCIQSISLQKYPRHCFYRGYAIERSTCYLPNNHPIAATFEQWPCPRSIVQSSLVVEISTEVCICCSSRCTPQWTYQPEISQLAKCCNKAALPYFAEQTCWARRQKTNPKPCLIWMKLTVSTYEYLKIKWWKSDWDMASLNQKSRARLFKQAQLFSKIR